MTPDDAGRARVTVRQSAPDGDRFAAGAFERAVGTEFTMTGLGGRPEGTGTLVAGRGDRGRLGRRAHPRRARAPGGAAVSDQQPARPIVWAFCNGTWGRSDQAWVAITDDGVVLAQHISSSEAWGAHDVGPDSFPARRQNYLDALGTLDVDYRVLPLGEAPPAHVLERNQARTEATEAAAAANAHVRGEPDPTEEDDRG